MLEHAGAVASVHRPLQCTMSVRFSDVRSGILPPLGCGGAGVLTTQMNSVLAGWADSRCLRTLAQVTVRSLSGRAVYRALLAPVMSLAARIIAEPLIPPPLPALGVRSGERDHPPAVLAADEVPT